MHLPDENWSEHSQHQRMCTGRFLLRKLESRHHSPQLSVTRRGGRRRANGVWGGVRVPSGRHLLVPEEQQWFLDISSDAALEGKRLMTGLVCLHTYTHLCLCACRTWETHTAGWTPYVSLLECFLSLTQWWVTHQIGLSLRI